MLKLLTCIVASAALAGCSSPAEPATTPNPAPAPSAPTPTPTPTPPPAATPPEPTPIATPPPAPAAETNASAGDYVAPLFAAEDAVGSAADPASFADTNPFGYRNPWRP